MSLFLVTYHYSQGEPRRGCAGFDVRHGGGDRPYLRDTPPGRTHFGSDHATVYPLVCGFETDEDALVIHGTAATSCTWRR
jgi:hypothetical protein